MDRKQLRNPIEQKLQGNPMPFWRERSVDHEYGGFIAEMTGDGTLDRTDIAPSNHEVTHLRCSVLYST